MDMVQLDHFLSLVETKNITKSADLLFISRQGLRKSISSLEQELGTKLFCRTNVGMELTESGQIFYSAALSMAKEYQSAFSNLHKRTMMRKSVINFAVFHGFFANVSMEMIDSFFEDRSDINYISSNFNDDEVISQFVQGEFDFAITSDPLVPPQFEIFPLFRTYRCISVNSQNPLARLSRLKTTDLKEHTVMTCGPGFFDYPWIQRNCNEAGFKAAVVPIRDSLTLLQYANTGRLPTLTVPNICDQSRFTAEPRLLFWDKDELEKTEIDIKVITLKGKRISPDVAALIAHMQQYCQQKIAKLINCYPFSQQC